MAFKQVKTSKIPKKDNITKKIHQQLESLELDHSLEVIYKALGISYNGVRYALRAWNKAHPKKKMRTKKSGDKAYFIPLEPE